LSENADSELRPLLAPVYEAAREAWPDLPLSEADFVAYASERLPVDLEAGQAVEHLRGSDLFLACACSRGDERAIAAFDRELGPVMAGIVRGFRARATAPEDGLQMLREKILVGDADHAPRIESYDGRGKLKNWVRATAVRTLIDLTRRQLKEQCVVTVADEVLVSLPSPDDDPEIDHLKRLYRGEFKLAFESAVFGLEARERNMLRQHFVHGLSTEQIGAVHRVHKATAARRLAAAREHLLSATRKNLVRKLGIERGDVDSIMRLIESQLDVSMERLLATVGEGES